MCLVGELLWKRAAPKPFSSDQGFRFTDTSLSRRERLAVSENFAVKSVLLLLTQKICCAGPVGK